MFAKITKYWATTEMIFDPKTQHPVNRLVVILPGAGCEWAKQSGGCYMCGFKNATNKYSHGRLLPVSVFRTMIKEALVAHPEVESLAIYNGGSFFNPHEIPEDLPIWLSGLIADSTQINELFVESRPEFVTDEIIHDMVSRLGTKTLKVGIGLECVTDLIRYRCVNKGFSLLQYNKAIHILKRYGAHVLTYVLLKPLFLNEMEAIREAVKTTKYSFEQGSDEVALESAFVQKGTVMFRQFEKGSFKPPWLWSVIEVVRQTHQFGFVHVGGFTDEPPPIAIPSNCVKCSQTVMAALQHYREHYNPEIFDTLQCNCKNDWLGELNNESQLSFQERI